MHDLPTADAARDLYRQQRLEALRVAVTAEMARVRGSAAHHGLHPRMVLACWANGLSVGRAMEMVEQRARAMA